MTKDSNRKDNTKNLSPTDRNLTRLTYLLKGSGICTSTVYLPDKDTLLISSNDGYDVLNNQYSRKLFTFLRYIIDSNSSEQDIDIPSTLIFLGLYSVLENLQHSINQLYNKIEKEIISDWPPKAIKNAIRSNKKILQKIQLSYDINFNIIENIVENEYNNLNKLKSYIKKEICGKYEIDIDHEIPKLILRNIRRLAKLIDLLQQNSNEQNPNYGTLTLDKLQNILINGKFQPINNQYHAELNLILYLDRKGYFDNIKQGQRFYISVSKLCCKSCKYIIDQINKKLKSQVINIIEDDIINIPGTHDNLYNIIKDLPESFIKKYNINKNYLNELKEDKNPYKNREDFDDSDSSLESQYLYDNNTNTYDITNLLDQKESFAKRIEILQNKNNELKAKRKTNIPQPSILWQQKIQQNQSNNNQPSL